MSKIPTLRTEGWIDSIAEKADAAMSYFFISEKSQTVMYGSNVSSLAFIIQSYGNDELTLTIELQSQLTAYLGRIFDSSVVDATVIKVPNSVPTNGKMDVRLEVTVTQGGVNYSLSRLIKTLNSKIQEIITLNNGD